MDTAEKRDVRGNLIPNRATHCSTQQTILLDRKTDELSLQVTGTQRHQWLVPVGLTMLVCSVVLLLWFQIVVPRWIRFQEQLSCGSQHICMTETVVLPGQQPRTFLSLLYNERVTVIEAGKQDGADSHIYIGGFVSLPNWQQVTPQIHPEDVNGDGYMDLVITSPDFDGADPVLYNQGNGSFDWRPPERRG